MNKRNKNKNRDRNTSIQLLQRYDRTYLCTFSRPVIREIDRNEKRSKPSKPILESGYGREKINK